jgi:hypothetical protein
MMEMKCNCLKGEGRKIDKGMKVINYRGKGIKKNADKKEMIPR